MRIEYNKLVRDRIPEIIQQDGRQCGVEVLDESEYIQALRQKLVEEAQEAATCDLDELVKELVDLYEVIDSLMEAGEIDREFVLAKQEARRAERGGFERRLCLLWVE